MFSKPEIVRAMKPCDEISWKRHDNKTKNV